MFSLLEGSKDGLGVLASSLLRTDVTVTFLSFALGFTRTVIRCVWLFRNSTTFRNTGHLSVECSVPSISYLRSVKGEVQLVRILETFWVMLVHIHSLERVFDKSQKNWVMARSYDRLYT